MEETNSRSGNMVSIVMLKTDGRWQERVTDNPSSWFQRVTFSISFGSAAQQVIARFSPALEFIRVYLKFLYPSITQSNLNLFYIVLWTFWYTLKFIWWNVTIWFWVVKLFVHCARTPWDRPLGLSPVPVNVTLLLEIFWDLKLIDLK